MARPKKQNRNLISGRYATREAYNHAIIMQAKYEKATYRRFPFRLRQEDDYEAIEFLESQENVNDFLKNLVYDAMEKENRKKTRSSSKVSKSARNIKQHTVRGTYRAKKK